MGTQARDQLNQDAVNDYAAAAKSGAVLPAVEVYFDGSAYYLVDGFHRYFAAEKNNAKSMRCEVVNGSLHDARLRACQVNAGHGLRRSNADKRRAVNMLLDELAEQEKEWTEKDIAAHCAVDATTVTRVRSERGERELPPSMAKNNGGRLDSNRKNLPSEPETAIFSKNLLP
ncbi:MAG: ParB N-terminal domain-containing protein [Planctomycetota bacterium]